MSKKETILKFKKLNLTAPCPTDRGKTSSFGVGTYMNNPRFVFSSGDTKLMNKEMSFGRVEAAMAPGDFYAVLEVIRAAAAAPGEYKMKIETFGKSPGAGFKDPPVLLSDMWVGKDKDGIVSVSIISKREGFPTVAFPFGPTDSRFTKFIKNGDPHAKAEQSVLYARAWCNMMSQLMALELKDEYVAPEPWNPNGQQGGGNRGGGGGGNYQNNRGGGNYTNNSNYGNNGGGNSGGGTPKVTSPQEMEEELDDIPF